MRLLEGLESVVLHPPVDVDEHGSPTAGAGESRTVDGVLVAPGPSPESGARDRDAAVIALTLYLPEGTVVTRDQTVTVRGDTYAVDGEPAVWTGGDLTPGQVVVELRRGEG